MDQCLVALEVAVFEEFVVIFGLDLTGKDQKTYYQRR